MAESQHDRWVGMFEQARRDLEAEKCQNVVDTADSQQMISIIERSALVYGQKNQFERLSCRLYPTLKHVESFIGAVTSVSQYHPIGCLVWGAMQAVILCAFSVPKFLEDVSEWLGELNTTLSRFSGDLALYPDRQELQWPLQDIYESYLSFCVSTVRYLHRSTGWNYFSFLWSSPQPNLSQARARIHGHIRTFEKEVEAVHRQEVRLHNLSQVRSSVSTDSGSQSMYSKTLEKFEQHSIEPQRKIDATLMHRNPTFTGRKDELKEMHESLAPDKARQAGATGSLDRHPFCCVLHGLGGIGKSQLALEYMYSFREDYDALFWIPSEQAMQIGKHFAQTASRIEEVDKDFQKQVEGVDSQAKMIQLVSNWLQQTDRIWLLVFDNADSLTVLEPYIPIHTNKSSSIVITTQLPCFPKINEDFRRIEILSLDNDKSADLLFANLERPAKDKDEYNIACDIAEIVGGLPLAVTTIAGYISESDSSPEEFLAVMKRSSNAWQESKNTRTRNYNKTLGTVFNVALGELPVNARRLINILAFLNPDCVPEALLLGAPETKEFEFLRNQDQLLEMIRVLRRRHLINRETINGKRCLTMHRSLQWSIIVDVSSDLKHRENIYHEAFLLLRHRLPMKSSKPTPDPKTRPIFEELSPQVLSLRSHCRWPEPPLEFPVEFARILADVGVYLWQTGLWSDGREVLETAESIINDRQVPHVDQLRRDVVQHLGILNGLAGVSQRRSGMDRRVQALEIQRAIFGDTPFDALALDDRIRLLKAECDVGAAHWEQELYEELETIMAGFVAGCKAVGSEEAIPFEYAKYYHHMASAAAFRGDMSTAMDYGKRSVDLMAKAAGAEHSMTLLWALGLGVLHYFNDDLKQALELNQDILQSRKKVCGEFSAFTLESYSTCGFLLYEAGDLKEAEKQFEICLEKRKQSFWDREGVARAQYRYHLVLKKLGKEKKAQDVLDEAQKTRDELMEAYPEYLAMEYPMRDRMEIYDEMCSMFAGRFTGRIRSGGISQLES